MPFRLSNILHAVNLQVKTVVTSLITRISRVDATLAEALAPLRKSQTNNHPYGQSNRGDTAGVSYIANNNAASAAIPDWRKLYNEYKVEPI